MKGRILDCEWTILRALWDKPPMGMKDIIAAVQKAEPKIAWQYKTYHSYLRAMLDKGLIGCHIISARDKQYYPIITKKQALEQERRSLLSRVSSDSVGDLVAMLVQGGDISDEDKQQLRQLFERLDEEGGGGNA